MPAQTPEVLTDPLGAVVDLVTGIEPALDRTLIQDLVISVAGGRAKRRRLAQALLQRPAVLTDGRSPAPRVVGNLLSALRKVGAVNISAPVCAECGKTLRSFQRRGEDWYCGICGRRAEPCVGCGSSRPVIRDRAGQPHCVACQREGSDTDATETVFDIVTAFDRDIAKATVATAVRLAAPHIAQRQRLAWALQGHPDLLTGAGAHAPVPAVLRLIDAPVDAGARRRWLSGRACGRRVQLANRRRTTALSRGAALRVPGFAYARGGCRVGAAGAALSRRGRV